MTLALGIDIGTSGVRSAVVEGDSVVAAARADHPAQNPARIDAEKWWEAVSVCIRRQMAALNDAGRGAGEIVGVAVDGTSGSMVLTDADLRPVGPALMYDSKGFEAEAVRIAEHAADDHVAGGSNSALARAMRLATLADAKPAHLLHQADFIAAKLLGFGGNSDWNNALKTGYDPETECWPDRVGMLVDPDILPEVHAPGTPVDRIDSALARTFGLGAETVIHAGTTDSIAAFLAAAPLREGVAVTSLGSTLAVKLPSPVRIDDPAMGLYSHRLGNIWLAGGASNTGGAVLRSFFDDEAVGLLSARIDPARPTGLDYYPLRCPGERFPVNDAVLRPRLDPRPDDDAVFLQGMFEGMARIEAACYRGMEARGAPYPAEIYTAGGGGRNPVWRKIRSATLGIELSTARHAEAAIGAAFLVLGKTGR